MDPKKTMSHLKIRTYLLTLRWEINLYISTDLRREGLTLILISSLKLSKWSRTSSWLAVLTLVCKDKSKLGKRRSWCLVSIFNRLISKKRIASRFTLSIQCRAKTINWSSFWKIMDKCSRSKSWITKCKLVLQHFLQRDILLKLKSLKKRQMKHNQA
jgi:hypothetical protein